MRVGAALAERFHLIAAIAEHPVAVGAGTGDRGLRLFDRVEVLGPHEVWMYPSLEAEMRGLAAAFSGELRTQIRQFGRGERSRDQR